MENKCYTLSEKYPKITGNPPRLECNYNAKLLLASRNTNKHRFIKFGSTSGNWKALNLVLASKLALNLEKYLTKTKMRTNSTQLKFKYG